MIFLLTADNYYSENCRQDEILGEGERWGTCKWVRECESECVCIRVRERERGRERSQDKKIKMKKIAHLKI